MKTLASALLFLLLAVPTFADDNFAPQAVPSDQCEAAQTDDALDGILEAGRGCCSHHGGMSGQCSNGRVVCRDGTISPTCKCRASDVVVSGSEA
ncbi:hypothetical protein [Desulfovibrio intestinalis]|uniref:Uncharacterized protein n=1 Tax=Desulfovibrio intestinalis TaxID=58621 RepID=A0A7W8C1M2_9BACT|nr:hypothetical protein [Desulfovibrio intestinalis]MBB5143962.1 hypothetical protein [Desulfovibrio intestinalis]